MLYKESAIAVMIAVMLGTASIFGGFSLMPALATHDPEAMEIARETIDNEDSVIVDGIELEVAKSSRASGTITVELLQGDELLRSANLRASSLGTSLDLVEVDVNNINVTGSFEVLVEYLGSGRITIEDVGVVQGTTVAEESEEGSESEGGDGSEDGDTSEPTPVEEMAGVVIATKTISPEEEEGMTVETVEFTADRSSRASGTLTVAIVQDDVVLDSTTIRSGELDTSMTDMEVSFDLDVTGNFQVVFMYEGSGRVTIADINVPGTTLPAEEPGDPTDPTPTGTVTLTVNAVDQSGNAVNGMWIEVYSGASASGEPLFEGDTPEIFELDAGQYIVAMADFESNIFQGWQDSDQDRTREATLTTDETFTAIYSTDGSSPPLEDPNPPPTSGPGSIVVFAHRIPNENWGPTFTSANAEMWYVLYNSTGWIVQSGFYDEEGTTITGLNDGETYYVYATDCDECHGDPHDVVFDHWEDSTTANPKAVATGDSAHAHYRYDPDP
jgi:hypothetical protein